MRNEFALVEVCFQGAECAIDEVVELVVCREIVVLGWEMRCEWLVQALLIVVEVVLMNNLQ